MTVGDIATIGATFIGALSLLVSMYQYLRTSYSNKLIFTLDRINLIATRSRLRDINEFLRRLDEFGQSPDADQLLGDYLWNNRDAVSAISSYVDDLEHFAVLYRKNALIRKVVDAELADFIRETFKTLLPLIRYQLRTPGTIYCNFAWLAKQMRNAKSPVTDLSWVR